MTGFSSLHDRYGRVFSLNIGLSEKIVVIGDYKVLKEIFSDFAAAARPKELMWLHTYTRYGNGEDSRYGNKDFLPHREFTFYMYSRTEVFSLLMAKSGPNRGGSC